MAPYQIVLELKLPVAIDFKLGHRPQPCVYAVDNLTLCKFLQKLKVFINLTPGFNVDIDLFTFKQNFEEVINREFSASNYNHVLYFSVFQLFRNFRKTLSESGAKVKFFTIAYCLFLLLILDVIK